MTQLSKIPANVELAGVALEQLMIAFAKGERVGHVEWEDIEIALEYAKEAWPGHYEGVLKELAED